MASFLRLSSNSRLKLGVLMTAAPDAAGFSDIRLGCQETASARMR
jgi:hypothetical protein